MLSIEERKQVIDYVTDRLGVKLNPAQRLLVEPIEKPKVCLANPGAGKTTAITLATIFEELLGRIPGSRILPITFTNKAAREFEARHDRYMKNLGLVSNIEVSTIHAMCMRYVEIFHTKLGMMKAELLSDEDARGRLKMIIGIVLGKEENKIQPKLVDDIKNTISFLSNRMIFTKEEAAKTHAFIDLKMDIHKFFSIRELYQTSQRDSGTLDFDEFMLCFYEILRDNENTRREIQNQLDAIIVDEFQDTSRLQYGIIKLLKKEDTRLTVVGDQDQSIYRWRGASDVFQDFFQDYPDCELIKMNINYRCPDHVIKFANTLIRNNTKRVDMESVGTGKKGKIIIEPVSSNEVASKVIANEIIRDYEASGRDNYTLVDRLVLYRNHSQGMFLVYDLASKQVPIVTSGVTLLHNEKMVKDLLDIINFLANPRSSILASNNMFKISTQITKPKDPDKCPFRQSSEKDHFAEIQVNVNNPVKYRRELESLVHISKMIRENKPARDIFTALIPMYMDAYYRLVAQLMNKTDEDINAISSFLTAGIDKTYDVSQFRQMLMMAEQFVNNSKKENNGVRVYSIHTAKGLEAKKVYLLDWNGFQQPNPKVIENLVEAKAFGALEDYINEERSLAYVAITRTEDELFMTYNKDCPSPFNWESGINEGLVVRKNVLSLEKLTGVKPEVPPVVEKKMEIPSPTVESETYTPPVGGSAFSQPFIGVPVLSDKSIIEEINSTFANAFTEDSLRRRDVKVDTTLIDAI